jgi:DNA-directed RNA polymerase subunit RPC12/RpoP
MAISVTCDACGARFKAPDAAAGKKGKCSKCGAKILVPELAPVASAPAMDDDLYDVAGTPPPPMPSRPAPAPAPAPAYNPPHAPASPVSTAAVARGVVPKSAAAGAWKKANNPPPIMKVLAILGGGFLILLGLLFVAGPIMAMMSDKTGKTIRFKGVFIGVALIATGITTIFKAFAKDD